MHTGSHTFPTETVTEVGWVVITWNQVELLTQMIANHLLKVDWRTSEVIFASPSVPLQADVLEAIVEERFPATKVSELNSYENEFRSGAIKAAKKMKALSNFRNDVVHGRWTNDDVDQQTSSILMKKGTEKPIDTKTVFEKSAQIKQLRDDLGDLWMLLTAL